ncbi:hypothetical protein BsIDN1_56820 [Bacillus safensis]|uniref:Threonine synthase n=1 Tax=Bacillus safensis TaxID=561879 RepID=A0A5S9MIR3_BACIA|nr:hypothetical protein BsIDN1_56820 [Bacillus safensis]
MKGHDELAEIVIITHQTSEEDFSNILQKLNDLDVGSSEEHVPSRRERFKPMKWNGLIEEFQEFLPVNESTPKLTLNEGNTPLVHLAKLSEKLGIELHVKTEGVNPTGSFKDRGMVMAVAKAKEEGNDTIMCASTGNTSAAAAAYAARADMKCIVIIPDGKIAFGKLAQAVMYGAEIIAIDGNFDDALKIVRSICEKSADCPCELGQPL